MHIVKSVGVMSIAKIMGLIYACIGLILSPLFLLIGLLGSMAGQSKTPFAGMFGVVFAVLLPVTYGVLGFIAGAIGALLYNLFARLAGGFELQLELLPDTPTAPYPIIPPAIPASNS
jgi:hypothetical protein